MKKWLRRIRGAVGMGLTWAAAWFLVSAVTAVASIGFPVMFAAFGFVGGAIFSVVLGIAERRRSFEEMSISRFAAWGAVGGLFATMIFFRGGGPETVLMADILTLLGAGCAAGSLVLARRAGDRELIESGEEALGLIEGEPAP